MQKRPSDDIPCRKRDAEINNHTFRYHPHGDVSYGICRRQSKPVWEYGNEEVGVNGIEQNLKYAVESHKTCSIFTATLGKIVPHKYHGDTTRQSYHDKSVHVFGVRREEQSREDEHQQWTNNPVEY